MRDAMELTASMVLVCVLGALAVALGGVCHRLRAQATRTERSHEDLRLLYKDLLVSSENERRLMAHELHDELAQVVTGVRYNIESVRRCKCSCRKRTFECLDRLSDIQEAMDYLVGRMRRIGSQLRPPLLEEEGLEAALVAVIDNFEQASRISVDYYIDGLDERLPDNVELGVFRIAQESLTNILRHANASQVELRLERQGAHAVLRVSDDGVGFTYPAPDHHGPSTPETAGLGLRGLVERARFLGGGLKIRTGPGKGSTVEARIPVEQPTARSAESVTAPPRESWSEIARNNANEAIDVGGAMNALSTRCDGPRRKEPLSP
jgi:signal transduction histidine kinase